MDAKELKQYRNKLYTDLYSNVVPDRIPITDSFGIEFFLKYNNEDLIKAQYSLTVDMLVRAMDKVREFAVGDIFNLGAARNGVGAFFRKSQLDVMSKTGFIQHPETNPLSMEELDDYILSPFDYNLDHIIPRQNLSYSDDVTMRMINVIRMVLQSQDFNKTIGGANAQIAEKYGLFTNPAGTTGRNPVCFDCLSDRTRGFSQIVMDIKREPQKILDAVESYMPYAIHVSNKSRADILGNNTIMTHMGVFLRNKEFDKFYWPTFNKICHISAARGQNTMIFCEGDWTRFIDELEDLPQGTRMYMEYGDPQKFKDRLGKKFVLGGFYPVTLLKNGTKQQCIDKAKELIDIMAPGGNYFFKFDKTVLDPADIEVENYVAVMDYVQSHGKYDNAGERISDVDTASTITYGFEKEYPEFKASYLQSFEDFSADYPPCDEKATDLLRQNYNKYTSMVEAYLN